MSILIPKVHVLAWQVMASEPDGALEMSIYFAPADGTSSELECNIDEGLKVILLNWLTREAENGEHEGRQ